MVSWYATYPTEEFCEIGEVGPIGVRSFSRVPVTGGSLAHTKANASKT